MYLNTYWKETLSATYQRIENLQRLRIVRKKEDMKNFKKRDGKKRKETKKLKLTKSHSDWYRLGKLKFVETGIHLTVGGIKKEIKKSSLNLIAMLRIQWDQRNPVLNDFVLNGTQMLKCYPKKNNLLWFSWMTKNKML